MNCEICGTRPASVFRPTVAVCKACFADLVADSEAQAAEAAAARPDSSAADAFVRSVGGAGARRFAKAGQ